MPARLNPIWRTLRLGAIWIALGIVLAILLAVAAPFAIGDRTMVVESGSMTPAIETGDAVVVEPISPLDAMVGDIVTFQDPDGSGRLISHRARSIRRAGDKLAFITQGDANTGQEHWSVPVDGQIGKVLYRVPKIGFAVVWAGTPFGHIGLLAIPALLLTISLLVRIWRPRPEGEASDALS
jgi:signal peptidase I